MIRHLWSSFMALPRTLSIQFKIMGLVVGLVILLGLGAILQTRLGLVKSVGRELDKRGSSLARDIAARAVDPLLTRNTLQLHNILRDTMANNSEVRYLFIQDGRGSVIAHTFVGGFPHDLLKIAPATSDGADLPVQVLKTEEGLVHEAAAVIASSDFGTVRVGMSEVGLYRSVVRVERNLLAAIIFIALVAIGVAWQLTQILTEPILALVRTARAAAKGDLTGRVEARLEDEVGELVNAFNQMLESLAGSKVSLEAYARTQTELVQKLMTAQEDERKRIARELHDDTGQAITSLMVGIKLIEQLADDPGEVRSRSAELRVFAAHTLESVRRLSRQLRPSVLDDAGLIAALRRHISDFGHYNRLSVDFQVVGPEERRLPPEVETAAYRIVQEALTNVARHARSRNASIVIDLSGDLLMVVVEDDGVGFDATNGAETLGILGMRERATLLGGSLAIESRAGNGTAVFAKLPVGGGVDSCVS